MNWTNIRLLERQLKDETLPAKDLAYYLIVPMAVLSLLSLGNSEIEILWLETTYTIVSTVIFVAYTLHLFKICERVGKGNKFLAYFVSIGLVHAIRLLLPLVLIVLALAVVFNVMNIEELILDYAIMLLFIIFEFIYYQNMINSFKTVLDTEKLADE
ncbi:hypothetical protein [Roseivirga pacifica]|uniref:hypothetical protein n=1 Tax=Roseivirga pacifica TaxID=1267423 RepID=UPI003BAB509F